MNGKRVFLFEQNGDKVLGFDTGLSSRAFAQAKFAQVITDPGVIVRPGKPGGVELWKPSGVVELENMVVWGPPFEGERLDILLNDNEQDKTLAAISLWIQAVLAVEKEAHITVPFWPCAAIAGENEVFFAPPALARRCIMVAEGESAQFSGGEWYVHADLDGSAAAAFTAAAMLYRVFAGEPPFPAVDDILLHQDMRDGNFLPVRFAVPGLDGRLAALIQSGLYPPEIKVRRQENLITGTSGIVLDDKTCGEDILDEFLAILRPIQSLESGGRTLVQPLSSPDLLTLEKEKAQFLKVHTASVKTRRFIARNTAVLLGCFAGIVVIALIISNMISAHARLPTTAGMDPFQVIASYYDAIGELDHQIMEACVIEGAGKDDINMVINFFVVSRMRQAYEVRFGNLPPVIPAKEWQESGGGPVDMVVLGVTDLHIEEIAMNDKAIRYRVDYIFWAPFQTGDDQTSDAPMTADSAAEPDGELLPQPYRRTDLLTLVQRKGNWRISELQRQ